MLALQEPLHLAGSNGANFTLAWTKGGNTTRSYTNALKKFGDVAVMSRPSIRVANNTIGSLTVGKTIFYAAGVTLAPLHLILLGIHQILNLYKQGLIFTSCHILFLIQR